jgi:hypothetical protein
MAKLAMVVILSMQILLNALEILKDFLLEKATIFAKISANKMNMLKWLPSIMPKAKD